jgi:hypothetical protein
VAFFRKSQQTIVGDSEMRIAGGSTCTTPTALRKKTRGSVAEFGPHFKARDPSTPRRSGFLFKDSLEKPRAEVPES